MTSTVPDWPERDLPWPMPPGAGDPSVVDVFAATAPGASVPVRPDDAPTVPPAADAASPVAAPPATVTSSSAGAPGTSTTAGRAPVPARTGGGLPPTSADPAPAGALDPAAAESLDHPPAAQLDHPAAPSLHDPAAAPLDHPATASLNHPATAPLKPAVAALPLDHPSAASCDPAAAPVADASPRTAAGRAGADAEPAADVASLAGGSGPASAVRENPGARSRSGRRRGARGAGDAGSSAAPDTAGAGRFMGLSLPGPALDLGRAASPSRSRVDDDGDAAAAQRPASSLTPLFAHARAVDERLGVRARVLVFLIAVTLVVLGICLPRLMADPAAADTPTAGVAFPGPLPDGVTDARWATPALDAQSAVTVLDSGRAAAYVTAGHRLAVSGLEGSLRWSTSLPRGSLSIGPVESSVDGVGVVMAHVGERLIGYAVDDGRIVVDVAVPDGASVSFEGASPLVRLDGRTAAVVTREGLSRVSLPEGATALAAQPRRVVLAGSSVGWWHLSPGAPAPAVTPWESTGAAPQPRTPVADVGASVVLMAGGARPAVEVHHDGDAVRPTFRGAITPGRAPVWAASPSRTWGILGRSLVDIRTGSVVDLGDWETVLVAHDRAYGLVGGVLHVAGPGLRPTRVGVTTALVEAGTATGSFVRASTPDGPRVWFATSRH